MSGKKEEPEKAKLAPPHENDGDYESEEEVEDEEI
jgi:hypothetical protein